MLFLNKIYLLLPLSVLLSAPANADSLQDKCSQMYRQNPPKVSITYNYGQLKYDNGKSTNELNAIYNKTNTENRAQHIHGLTVLAPHVTTAAEVQSIVSSNDTACFLPRSLEIKIWYEPTVYIADSLQNGTCRYNTTVRHELTHLDLGHHALYLFAKSLKASVPQILSAVSPRVEKSFSANGKTITNQMTEAYQKQVLIRFEKFKNNLEKYNRIIDTPENYAIETKLCPTD